MIYPRFANVYIFCSAHPFTMFDVDVFLFLVFDEAFYCHVAHISLRYFALSRKTMYFRYQSTWAVLLFKQPQEFLAWCPFCGNEDFCLFSDLHQRWYSKRLCNVTAVLQQIELNSKRVISPIATIFKVCFMLWINTSNSGFLKCFKI